MDIKKLQKQLGLRLKELRLAKGFKQEDLEDYGFSYRYYGKLERGDVNPTLETLFRLSEIFEISLADLFAFMEKEVPLSENGQAVAIKIGQILKQNDGSRIRKLKIFLDDIL
ncbi:helix-turn-helix domain-containing protein [Desulfotignum phosphitoxidans]|uniref:Transcriptional regulator, XRE family n=1 Tax=Desulfotignum phosphitoxidans DSM 13687 TaxID=1286635 RepID=S0FYZ0_9BACT|nr:helix-turn-helix transcriptional regulator [Desulfotignum phosphitoxidans]EMS78429.1 transcriptional regulator, XRE family [Desulfotignum phosphitoxidans DSM 13687]